MLGGKQGRPMEDFEADLSALKIKRGALLEQLKKGEGDRENLKAELERIDAQIAVLEDAIENDDAPRP
jgi:peptidoglycan hydrolase CwlO-like protein